MLHAPLPPVGSSAVACVHPTVRASAGDAARAERHQGGAATPSTARLVVGDDRGVTDSDAVDLVRRILGDLQDAVRSKDHARTLALFTQDAALLGTGAAA